ncbi:MAG: hypothetical protein Q7R94_01970, partial [bacterium]|nr:hypothetical protein [bacterium]
IREWLFRLPHLPFPEDYTAATIETIVLYTLSIVSSFLYRYKKLSRQTAHKKIHGKVIHQEAIKSPALMKEGPSVVAAIESAQSPKVEVVLTKASTLEDQSAQAGKKPLDS